MNLGPLIQSFDKVFIDRLSLQSPLAERLRFLFPTEKIEIVNERPFSGSEGHLSSEEFDRSKKNLYVTPFKGDFFKRCPGARPGLACCNYFVLNWGLQCDMNCSYCYLQSFINTPVLTIYSNLDKALSELEGFVPTLGDQPLRVGTGETVDSLSLDPLTMYSHDLIEFFRDKPRWTLEFKTKSDRVEQFLDCDHSGNVVVSWSVNAMDVIEKEEHGTASLEARLSAAENCLNNGFPVAFHIDPMIWYENWRDGYADLVDQITHRFQPDDMPYISVGALRFQPEQRHIMRERFGMNSFVTGAELFKGPDGKLRYHQDVRKEMFEFLTGRFKTASKNWKLFLCMETPETWLASTGSLPQKKQELETLFDPRLIKKHQKATHQE